MCDWDPPLGGRVGSGPVGPQPPPVPLSLRLSLLQARPRPVRSQWQPQPVIPGGLIPCPLRGRARVASSELRTQRRQAAVHPLLVSALSSATTGDKGSSRAIARPGSPGPEPCCPAGRGFPAGQGGAVQQPSGTAAPENTATGGPGVPHARSHTSATGLVRATPCCAGARIQLPGGGSRHATRMGAHVTLSILTHT